MRYESTQTCTCNEGGQAQVDIVYANGVLRYLFGLPLRKESYVAGSLSATVWREKYTGRRASTTKELEITNVIAWNQQKSAYGLNGA